jgi:RHS repeat-associated protein
VDQDYRPVRVEDAASDGLSLAYQFDAVGNITQLTNGDGSAILARYGYDALDRLDDVMDGPTGVSIETYTYDATGNRLSEVDAGGTTSYAYPANSHRLASVGGIARAYDAAGNTSQAGGDTYAYNATNRLSGVSRSGSTIATYADNAKGERVWWQDATETYAVYDESGHLLAIYDALGAIRQEFVWLDDLPIGIVTGSGTGAALLYIEPDHLGTPRVVIDPVRQKAVWIRASEGEAFGATAPSENPDADGVSFTLDLRFPGQRHDAASGLDYNYLRDYDTSVGRYVQSDPVGLIAGPSTYAYVEGKPISFVDPLGLDDVSAVLYGAGVIKRMPERSSNLRGPDFVKVSVNYFVGTFSLTRARNGRVYISKGFAKPYPHPVSAGVSASVGWVNQCETPTPEKLDALFTGPGGAIYGAYDVLGGQFSYSPGAGSTTEVGVGLGVSATDERGAAATGGIGGEMGSVLSNDGWGWGW